MNNNNLIKNSDLTPQERKEKASKMGKASVKARREKKMLRETLAEVLTMSLSEGKSVSIDKVKNFADAKAKNITVQDAIVIAQVTKALEGDVRAAEFIRDTLGQKPKSVLEVQDDARLEAQNKLDNILAQLSLDSSSGSKPVTLLAVESMGEVETVESEADSTEDTTVYDVDSGEVLQLAKCVEIKCHRMFEQSELILTISNPYKKISEYGDGMFIIPDYLFKQRFDSRCYIEEEYLGRAVNHYVFECRNY